MSGNGAGGVEWGTLPGTKLERRPPPDSWQGIHLPAGAHSFCGVCPNEAGLGCPDCPFYVEKQRRNARYATTKGALCARCRRRLDRPSLLHRLKGLFRHGHTTD